MSYPKELWERAKELRADGMTYVAIHSQLVIEFGSSPTANTIRNKLKANGDSPKKNHLTEHRLRKKAKTESRAKKEVVEELDKTKREFNALLKIQSYKGDYQIKATRSKHIQATAFILAGDWHAEEEVVAESVNHLNEFNLKIADKRIGMFFSNACRLLKQRAGNTDITQTVLVLGGDFISGNIHDELLAICQLPPMDAILWVQKRILSGITLINDTCKELGLPLLVVCKVGNHTRITQKVFYSTEEGNSLEWMMYHNLSQMLDVDFVIDRSYLTYIDVYGYAIRCQHGHAVRYGGGIGGLTIPLNKAIAQWNKAKPAHLDILFHWHQQTNTGNAIVNGSLIGFNPFAIRIKASFEKPKQKFFLFTSKGDVTGEEVIFLQ